MKKMIIALLMFPLFIVGCNDQVKSQNPKQVLNDIVDKDYKDGKVLCVKSEKDFYAALLETEKEISLVILEKNKDNSYEFFGSSSYLKEKDDYARYEYTDNQTWIIVFSENTKGYSNLSLTFDNIEKEEETAIINSKITENSCIIKFFNLPSDYSLKHIELN